MDLDFHKFYGGNSIIIFGVADYSRALNKRELAKRQQKGEPDVEFIVRRVEEGLDPDRVNGILLYRGGSFGLAISAATKFADTNSLPVWLRRYQK